MLSVILVPLSQLYNKNRWAFNFSLWMFSAFPFRIKFGRLRNVDFPAAFVGVIQIQIFNATEIN